MENGGVVYSWVATLESQQIHKMGYRQLTIGDLCKQDRTIVRGDSQLVRELPFLGLENIESVTGRILCDRLIYSNEGNGTAYLFDERHVLYCKLRPYLNKVAVPNFAGRCTTELIPLLPTDGISRDYLAWLLRRPQTVQAAMKGQTGARMPRASMKHVLALSVIVPDTVEEQQRIADEMTRILNLVVRAKTACTEQLQLLDVYIEKALFQFPFLGEADNE